MLLSLHLGEQEVWGPGVKSSTWQKGGWGGGGGSIRAWRSTPAPAGDPSAGSSSGTGLSRQALTVLHVLQQYKSTQHPSGVCVHLVTSNARPSALGMVRQ